jgi:hypothetical protein
MPATQGAPEPGRSETADLVSGNVVLAVEGYLDVRKGEALVKSAAAAVDDQTSRLDIDLSACTGYTEEGAGSLVACREVCADLPDGLHYRTTPGPGQEALLVAYQGADDGSDSTPDADLA